MATQSQSAGFFVAGGTLRPDTPSYVKRPADDELFKRALAGEYCHVLTSRQMGKSSLMIRTARGLKKQGVRTAIVDLALTGKLAVTAEQWYLAFVSCLKDPLKLTVDPQAWWQAHAALGLVQRFTDFLRDVVLGEVEEPVVIFVDEIDSTLGLGFTDDFFVAIRGMYNARAHNPIYKRLTFVLLGVATPADLIRDRRRTPYNIGHAIALQEFGRAEAKVLQTGLEQHYPGQGQIILDRIFYWTNGHPYLTQKLCLDAVEDKRNHWDITHVDDLVERRFFSDAPEKESNLSFVQDNIAASAIKRDLLKLYRRIYAGRQPVRDAERDRTQNQLKLVGLVRPEKGILQVRNRIYHHVFDEKWISETMPRDGLRWLAIASPVIALLVLAFFLVPVYLGIATPWNRSPASIQEKTLRESFLSTTSADVQISSMAQLIKLGSAGMARDLFFGLSLAQQVALFENANVDAVGREAITSVVDLVFSDESVSADVRLAILAKLFESTGYEADAKRLFSEELSSADRIALFRTATVPLVGPQIVAVFEAVCHSASADVRLAILARLLEGDAYRAQARQLFFKELSPEEQIVLFQTADPQAVGPELVAAVRGIYPQLNNTQNNNKLLAAMAQSLREMSNPEAASLSSSIDQWLMGREAYDEARNETALAALNEVIKFDSENTEAYFDRALIYVQSEDYEEALADLETALKLDDEKRLVSRTKLTIDSDLKFAQAWMELMDQYPTLKAALPRSSVTTTNVIVQASGEGESTVELSINDDAGNRICGDMIVLTQGQSYEASAASSCQARGRFVGSGVVSSDQPVSAVNLDLVTLQSGELEFVTRAHMDAAMSLPSAKSFLPLVATAPNFLRSAALIRNFGSNSTKAEVYFLDRSGRVFARKTVELSAGGLKYIGISDTQDTIAAPEGWSGTVEVVSEMGSVVASGYGCQEFYCTEYIGFSSGSRHWFVPGLARDVLTTGETKAFSVLSIMNTSETDQAEVTITFRNTGKQERRIIPSLGSVEISTQKMAGLPSESTAEIRSEGAEIVVTAQYLNPPDNQGEAYNALAAEEGGKELFLPDVSWAEERKADTVIYLQNLTGEEIVPTLFLYDRVRNSANMSPSMGITPTVTPTVKATGTSTPTVELGPALPFYGGKLPVQPFEQEMSPLGAYQTLKIDVGKYLADAGLTAWEGSAVIKADAEMGAVIITRSNGKEQWATAYTAVAPND